jgi:NADH-quinone oxidoreductase subunit E
MLCKGTACHVNGADMIEEAICENWKSKTEKPQRTDFSLNNVAAGLLQPGAVMMIKSDSGDETYAILQRTALKRL